MPTPNVGKQAAIGKPPMNLLEPVVGGTRQTPAQFATPPTTSKAATESTSDGGSVSSAARDTATVLTLSKTAQASMANETAGKKDFAAVAKDARAIIDAKYAELAAKGAPMDYVHATRESWDTVYGGLDRRSLFAIASNSDGGFSKEEQDTAQSIMSQQQGQAMMVADPTGNDPAARYRAGVSFLDGVSDEEKSSNNWAVQRAATQFGYEQTVRDRGQEPENLDSDSPLVRMIKGALHGLKDKEPGAVATGGYVKDLKDMPLFRNGVPTVAAGVDRSLNIKA